MPRKPALGRSVAHGGRPRGVRLRGEAGAAASSRTDRRQRRRTPVGGGSCACSHGSGSRSWWSGRRRCRPRADSADGGAEHAVFEVGVFGAEPIELALDAGIGEVDGELAGGDVGGDEDEGDEEDGGGEADEQVGEDELAAEAPQHAFADLPPEHGDGQKGEREGGEDLKHARKGADGAGDETHEPEETEPDGEPEDGSVEAARETEAGGVADGAESATNQASVSAWRARRRVYRVAEKCAPARSRRPERKAHMMRPTEI